MDPSSTPTPASSSSTSPTTTTTHTNTNTNITSSSLTTPSPSTSTSITVPSPTADILLSLAKTDQYISHLVHLLIKVVTPYYLCLANNNNNNNNNNTGDGLGLEEGYNGVLHTIGPELTLLARMVHAWIVWKGGKDMGMERLGLSYGTVGTHVDDGGSVGDECGGSSGLNHRNECRTLPRIFSNKNSNHTASYLCATSFVVLYTIGPYLIHRAGGRSTGWDDPITLWNTTKRNIQRILHQLPSWIIRFDHGEEEENSENYDGRRGEEGGTVRRLYPNNRRTTTLNHESLRGEERRRAYEDSRRRMLQWATTTTTTTRTHQPEENRSLPTITTTTTTVPVSSNDSVITHDNVDPSSRMATTTTTTTQTPFQSHNRFVSNTARSTALLRNGSRRRFIWDILRCISRAIRAQAPLPHGRVPLVLPLTNQQQQQQQQQVELEEEEEEEDDNDYRTRNNTRNNDNNDPTATYLKRYTAVIEWLIRLNLALFYTNGRYPTLLHRITGVRFRNHNYRSHAPLNNPPTTTNGIGGGGSGDITRPSYDTIGKMVLLQTLVTLVRAVSHLIIDAWTARVEDTQEHEAQQQQRRRRERQRWWSWWWNDGNTTVIERERTNVQDANNIYERQLETCVPSLKSIRDGNNTLNEPTTAVHRPLATATTTTKSTPCSICMNHRTHPAALVGCGHVFCWECVQRWISMVRAECPICRAMARPQDVLPLYHYDNAS